MAPSGDMPTPEAQAESFSLANMVPQDPGSNRCLWEGIESAVRELAVREGEAWVLTGPVFQGSSLQRLNGRVLVPTSLYKAVYLPARHAVAAYVAPNGPGMEWQAVSLAALRDLAGIDAFPGLPSEVAARAMPLPEPRPHDVRGSCERAGTVVAEHRPPARPLPGPTATRGGGLGSVTLLVASALAAAVAGFALYRVLGRR
jgi:endonuclease G